MVDPELVCVNSPQDRILPSFPGRALPGIRYTLAESQDFMIGNHDKGTDKAQSEQSFGSAGGSLLHGM